MYVALKHIGGKYTPGEILPDDLPADEVKWLLEAGAIREEAPALSAPYVPETPEKTETNTAESTSETAPQSEIKPDEEPSEETDVEADEEAEAPEIDITEGLVSGDTETAKPATRKTSRRGKTK